MMMHIPVFLNWFLTKLFWHGFVRLGWGFKLPRNLGFWAVVLRDLIKKALCRGCVQVVFS
jgi:hypothetical protein